MGGGEAEGEEEGDSGAVWEAVDDVYGVFDCVVWGGIFCPLEETCEAAVVLGEGWPEDLLFKHGAESHYLTDLAKWGILRAQFFGSAGAGDRERIDSAITMECSEKLSVSACQRIVDTLTLKISLKHLPSPLHHYKKL